MSTAPEAETDARCTCASDGNARRCPHHTQADYDASAANDASGLTGAEKASLMRWRNRNYGALFEAVERIVAERLRVVEGERDAAREELAGVMLAAGHDLEQAWARAESAEAAHAALVAGVEALAELPTPGPAVMCASPKDRDDQWRAVIRALLAGGGE